MFEGQFETMLLFFRSFSLFFYFSLNFSVSCGIFYSSQLWITGGSYNSDLNVIEAGWHVSFNENKFFIYWTRNNFRSTGCYNLLCPGFAQTKNEYTLIFMSYSLILLGWFSI
ncbi:unnamed protein product [Coffea canephora]|uniref:Neprosin PEP catalytic domain-containing protein n=1 Tax=Coffea canephora TaxID=49390 RepID=A0A068V7H2_COFCA|nr:unnamed protein product [Coffea canephora]